MRARDLDMVSFMGGVGLLLSDLELELGLGLG